MNWFIRSVAILSVLCAAAPAIAADPTRVTVVRAPYEGVHPQVQTDSHGRMHLIYFKGEPQRGDIMYVRSDDGGESFTPPMRVNSQPESAAIIGTVRGPHLAIGKGDRVHVAWMGSDHAKPKFQGKHIPMFYTRLNDAGDAFEPQRNVIQNHPGLDGGGSVAADKDGNVYVAWHAGQGHDEQDRQVFVTRSQDDGKTFAAEVAAISDRSGACGCCGMNIFAADQGRVFITYRSASESVNRDIHLLASNDGGATFKVATVDPWTVGTCVMSTAAFARNDQNVLAAWETKDQVRVARVDGRGEITTIAMPGNEKKKHPSIAVNPRGETLVAWTEGTTWGKGGDLVWQVFNASGEPIEGQTGRANKLAVWSVPAATIGNDGAFRIFY